MKQLENKVALITGSGSGIGKAAAILFAEQGAKVVISDINESHGHSTVEELKKKGGDAFFIKADSSKQEDNEALIKQTIHTYGVQALAVNDAGIGGPLNATGECTIEGWQSN